MKGKFLAVLIGIIGVFACVTSVHALENDSTLRTEYLDKVYAYHYKQGELRSYGKLPYRYQNGLLAYCIEPNRVINNTTYNSTTDWNITGYDENVKKQMELIAYYGYQYPGHNTDRYYMATQELIWLYSDDLVKWMDEYSTDASKGNQINVDYEKNEILNLVNRHNLLPSLDGQCFNKYFGETITLNDINGVLKDYDVSSDLSFTKNDNSLNVIINKFGTHEITFTKKFLNDKKTTIYYVVGDSQMMASFSLDDEKNAKATIIIDKAKIRINKRDSGNKNLIGQAEVKFRINAKNNSLVDSVYVETDDNGYAYLELPIGNYEITEIQAPIGYVRNKNKITFSIDENITLNDLYYDIDIYNDIVKGQIDVVKEGEDGEGLDGVEFGLYDSNHNFIKKLATSNSTLSFTDLPLGKYYIKELKTKEGYILDNSEYEFNLNYINDRTSIVKQTIKLYNKKIRCDIVYISTNGKNKIKGVEINVYDTNNNIVFTGKTDKNGKIIISGLPYGKYYIKQIKVPSGYILNEEEYIFFVNDSTCLSHIDIHNDKTIMPVTSTSFNIGLLTIIFASIGIVNYVKKSN